MQVNCPSCSHLIPAEDINLTNALGKCSACNNVFSITSLVNEETNAWKKSVSLPRQIQVNRTPKGLEIIRKWFSPTYLFLAFFCVFWDGFLVVWYVAASNGPLAIKLFPLIHVAVGIGLTYTTIAGFINSTVISIDTLSIQVRHGPLPWCGNKQLSRVGITQLFCREHRHRNKHGYSYTYSVEALAKGDKIQLLKGLNNSEQAVYIETKMEEYLRIRDQRIEGEIAR